MLRYGGPVIVILLVMSIVAVTITIVKLYQFRSARLGDMRAIREALSLHRAGRSREALRMLAAIRNPMAVVLKLAIRGQMNDDFTETMVREEVVRVGADILEKLRIYLRPLEVIASLAPLLGLFGTVLGMIEVFRRLEEAGNQVNPSILSGGIWEALLTTAMGLAVAIPTVVVINWFDRILDRFGHEMEGAVSQVFTREITEGAEEHNEHESAHLKRATLGAGE